MLQSLTKSYWLPLILLEGNFFSLKVNSIDEAQNSQEENIVLWKYTVFSTMDAKANQSN